MQPYPATKKTHGYVRGAIFAKGFGSAVINSSRVGTLATDTTTDVRIAVAGNPSTLVSVLTTLATDSDGEVLWAVFTNRDISLEVLVSLVRSSYDPMLVSRHPDTPVGVLATLAGDPAADVRVAAAESRRLPAEVMNALSLDDDIRVRSAIHANKSAPDVVRAQAALLGVTAKGTK